MSTINDVVCRVKRLGLLYRRSYIWTTGTSLFYYDLDSTISQKDDTKDLHQLFKKNVQQPFPIIPFASYLHDCVTLHFAFSTVAFANVGANVVVCPLYLKDEHCCLHVQIEESRFLVDLMFLEEIIVPVRPGTSITCGAEGKNSICV